jgi:hypothetical protein
MQAASGGPPVHCAYMLLCASHAGAEITMYWPSALQLTESAPAKQARYPAKSATQVDWTRSKYWQASMHCV